MNPNTALLLHKCKKTEVLNSFILCVNSWMTSMQRFWNHKGMPMKCEFSYVEYACVKKLDHKIMCSH